MKVIRKIEVVGVVLMFCGIVSILTNNPLGYAIWFYGAILGWGNNINKLSDNIKEGENDREST